MNTQQIKQSILILCALMRMTINGTVFAGERESLEQLRNTTMSLIDMLVKEGVLSKVSADKLVKEAQVTKTLADGASSENELSEQIDNSAQKVVRVQYVPESVKAKMKEEIKNDVMAKAKSEGWAYPGSIPNWLNGIEWQGDIRLRYESDSFPDGRFGRTPYQTFNQDEFRNAAIKNTTEDRERFRLRARLGANMKFNDWLDGGVRITTGSAADPVSPNQTLQTSEGKYSFALDRAYLKANANSWLSLSGGRIANPWFSTDLMWDPDLSFDGVAATAQPKINDRLGTFVTVGAFPIEEIQSSSTNKARDKWIYGAQGGIVWKMDSGSSVKLGLAYYDFSNVEGIRNDNLSADNYDATVPVFRQKGNNTFDIHAGNVIAQTCGGSSENTGCGLASKFQVLNLTGQYDLANFNPVHVVLTTDYIVNLGFDANEILNRTGNLYKKENKGYQVKLAVGMKDTLRSGDWQVWGAYKRLEADSTLDAYTDSDFNLGGTNAKGWLLGASYGVDKNAWVTARWFSSDEITRLPLSVDVLLLDLNAKF